MSSISDLQCRIGQLEEEIRILQRERELGEDFIYEVKRGASHNEEEFDRRNHLALTAGDKRGRASFADKLMYKIQHNYGQSRRQMTGDYASSMLNKAYNRIDEIDRSIANKRSQISSLQAEIERIRTAEEEERRRREASRK